MSSVAELEREVSEKKERFGSITGDIEATSENIKELNIQISKVSNDITTFEHANRLFEALQSASELSRASFEAPEQKVNLNDEHLEIILKKRSVLKPLKTEMAKLAQEQQVLERELFETRIDNSKSANEILDLQEQTRAMNSRSVYLQSKNAWLRESLNERVNEKRILNQTKREAEQALTALKERAASNTTLAGGRLDLEKSITSLQDQYNVLRSDIESINQSMGDAKKERASAKEESRKTSESIGQSVNWRNEREELKKELSDLTQLINSKKKDVKTKEKNASKESSQYLKYSPLVKKWSHQLNQTEVPEGSISSLNEALNKEKETITQTQKQKHDQMAQLVVNNSKLEKEVERKKKSLERLVEQFHTDESQMKKSTEDKKNQFEEEEKKLIRQIDEMKLKLAQKYLQIK